MGRGSLASSQLLYEKPSGGHCIFASPQNHVGKSGNTAYPRISSPFKDGHRDKRQRLKGLLPSAITRRQTWITSLSTKGTPADQKQPS
jgi:hypothetical protein